MTEEKGNYPFIPIDLDKISRLVMQINCRRDSSWTMLDLLADLPLSIDGTNQWYAQEHLGYNSA